MRVYSQLYVTKYPIDNTLANTTKQHHRRKNDFLLLLYCFKNHFEAFILFLSNVINLYTSFVLYCTVYILQEGHFFHLIQIKKGGISSASFHPSHNRCCHWYVNHLSFYLMHSRCSITNQCCKLTNTRKEIIKCYFQEMTYFLVIPDYFERLD